MPFGCNIHYLSISIPTYNIPTCLLSFFFSIFWPILSRNNIVFSGPPQKVSRDLRDVSGGISHIPAYYFMYCLCARKTKLLNRISFLFTEYRSPARYNIYYISFEGLGPILLFQRNKNIILKSSYLITIIALVIAPRHRAQWPSLFSLNGKRQRLLQ